MKDLIRAIMGPNRCDWCSERDCSWWDRLMRFDQAMPTKDRHWYERVAMKIEDANSVLGIWKLGRRWHWRYHEASTD